MPKLVIVESPAKAKTISKYLGRGYKVTASMGHVRDLPASQLGIDVDNGFAPKYITIKGKQKLVKELKAEAKKCDGVLLATDPDREGEAISWHLANILGLDPAAPNRVTFDEITKKGVKEGMAHPRAINIDLFNAQQARRELDRLVGYKLSPFLWRKVRRGLSAGRVQSVAVRLIRDRELEIENFKPDEYWNIDAALYPQSNSKNGFTARLAATADGKKLTVTNKEQADTIVAALDGKSYTISKLEKGKRRPTRAALHHFHPAAGRQPCLWLLGHPHDARCPDIVRRHGHCRPRHRGSDHLHAYRLAAHRRRGQRRRQTVHRGPLGRQLRLQHPAQVEVPLGHGRPGRPRSDPPVYAGTDPR